MVDAKKYGIYDQNKGMTMLGVYASSDDVFTLCALMPNGLEAVAAKFGPGARESYIAKVVETIKGAIRRTDIFAAMDNGEFLLIFPFCEFDIVDTIMTTVCKKLDIFNQTGGQPYEVSISYGIVELINSEGKDAETAYGIAEKQMQRMKSEYDSLPS